MTEFSVEQWNEAMAVLRADMGDPMGDPGDGQNCDPAFMNLVMNLDDAIDYAVGALGGGDVQAAATALSTCESLIDDIMGALGISDQDDTTGY